MSPLSKTILTAEDVKAFKYDHRLVLDSLIDNLQGMVYCNLYDEHWTMIFASEGAERLTGYKPQDLMYNKMISYEEVTHQDDREFVRNTIAEAVASGSTFEFEYRIKHADGHVVWVLERGNALYGEKGQVLALEGYIQNISKRKNYEHTLRETEFQYRSIFENSVLGIFQTTLSGEYLLVNASLARIYGYESADELKHALNNIQQQLYVLPQRRDEFVVAMSVNGRVESFEYEVYKKDGSTIWISENARMVYDATGTFLYYEGSVHDITTRKKAEEKSYNLAFYDPLTNLPNRRLFVDRLNQALAYTMRNASHGALLFLDLDHFKTLNDSLGHDIGDVLLQQVSDRLISCVRQGDTVARIGGDEFVLLLEGLSEHPLEAAAQTETIAEKILALLNQPYQLGRHDYQNTPSVGVVLFSDQKVTQDELLKQADIAMYQAKKSGRNRVSFFDPHMQEAINSRVDLERELRKALDLQQFELHYQIQVDHTGKPIGAESLIRWRHPTRGMISPFHFIPLAEETNLILPMGQWVLNAACKQLGAWQLDERTRDLVLAVNVSAKQFRQPDFVAQVQEAVLKNNIKPDLLKLELTESMLVENIEQIIDTMNALKSIGIKFSLDDFGTGYSSLQYLKLLPLNQLKIDQSFVRDIATDFSDRAIVLTIITMAHSLGLDVIAEGVETEEQRQFLFDNGCSNYQGYLFSKPVAIEALEKLLY